MPGFAAWASRWWKPVLFIVIAGHVTNVCVTLFLHRAQTHRSVKLHYLAALPMRLWLWLSTAIVTKEWVACHRKHHAFADREGDPHSPLMEGLRNIVLKGAFYYRKAVRAARRSREVRQGNAERLDRAPMLSPPQLGRHPRHAGDRRLSLRLLRRAARLGRSDDLDPVLGSRHHQRHRPRARLPELRGQGREPEHLANRDLARRRGAAQQPPRRSAVAPSSRRSGTSSTSAGSTSACSSSFGWPGSNTHAATSRRGIRGVSIASASPAVPAGRSLVLR